MDGEQSGMIIRALRAADLERLVRMDQKLTGRRREEWFEGKLKRALGDADVNISLGAELDSTLVGALFGSVQYGEFGLPEPVAILDTLLVDPAFARRGVASALFRQLRRNLAGLRVTTLRTEVGFTERELVLFFEKQGFKPAPRKVLELSLDAPAAHDRDETERFSDSLTPTVSSFAGRH